jgi:hypothetical protein
MRPPIPQFVKPLAPSSIQRNALDGHLLVVDGELMETQLVRRGGDTADNAWRRRRRLAKIILSRFPLFTGPILKGNSGRFDPFAKPSANGRYLHKRDARIRLEST